MRNPFRVEEDILLFFVLPSYSEEILKVDGKIVRVGPRGIGVEFKLINDEQRQLIKSFLDIY